MKSLTLWMLKLELIDVVEVTPIHAIYRILCTGDTYGAHNRQPHKPQYKVPISKPHKTGVGRGIQGGLWEINTYIFKGKGSGNGDLESLTGG